MCDCIRISVTVDSDNQSFDLGYAGQYDGRNYWSFLYGSTTYFVYWSSASTAWIISDVLGSTSPTNIWAEMPGDYPCPINIYNIWIVNLLHPYGNAEFYSEEIECPEICGREDRMFWKFDAIKIPKDFSEPNRGLDECCCEWLVLGSSGSSWENDKTSAWIKLSSGLDTHTFKLFKNGNPTTYTLTSLPLPEEPNGFYCTVNWYDVLLSDGPGCYSLKIQYNISGIQAVLNWGNYKLKPFTVNNAKGTARIRAVFNGRQEAEQINFTNADVVSDIRFSGFIGKRQPNMEIDNIIYGNREMKRVIRENLYTYEIGTDPLQECFIKPMIETYLLSENQLYISDYNVGNHSYRYTDLPVIVAESPEIEYYDFSRLAKLTCKVGDKFKTQRTYY
jgi:hypothetical protein